MEPVSEIPETSEAEVRLTAAKRQLNQELENISKMAQGKKLTRKEAAEQRREAKALRTLSFSAEPRQLCCQPSSGA